MANESTPETAAPDIVPDTIDTKPAPSREQALSLRDKAVRLLDEVLAEVPVVSGDANFGGLRSALAHAAGVIRLAVEESM